MSDDLIVAPAIYAPNGHSIWEAPDAPLIAEEHTTFWNEVGPMLHSTVAQQILKDTSYTTFEEFTTAITNDHQIEYTLLEKNVLFLGHLCACGLIDEAEAFIRTIENLSELLNTRSCQMYGGTVLNMALYWNSGDLGYKFFTMLTSYGATIMIDAYNLFPHEQTGTIWSSITDNQIIGKRNPSEFTMLYTKIHLALED